MYDKCMAIAYDGDAVLCPHHDLQWEVQKCAVPVLSDIFWISPANEASHHDLLSYLGSGDFSTVLKKPREHSNVTPNYIPIHFHCLLQLSRTLLH